MCSLYVRRGYRSLLYPKTRSKSSQDFQLFTQHFRVLEQDCCMLEQDFGVLNKSFVSLNKTFGCCIQQKLSNPAISQHPFTHKVLSPVPMSQLPHTDHIIDTYQDSSWLVHTPRSASSQSTQQSAISARPETWTSFDAAKTVDGASARLVLLKEMAICVTRPALFQTLQTSI